MDAPHVQEGDLSASLAEQNGILLEDCTQIGNLTSLHPPVQIVLKIQEIFTDRVDPLIKILHLPTFWPLVMDMIQSPQNVSKSLEALVFSVYFVTISYLEDSECLSIFGVQRLFLSARYRLATRQALVNASFLSTSSPMTLQAYAMFMVRSIPPS